MAFLTSMRRSDTYYYQKEADNEQYTLKDGEDTLFLTFEEGDTIQVESEESDFDSVYLMEWED